MACISVRIKGLTICPADQHLRSQCHAASSAKNWNVPVFIRNFPTCLDKLTYHCCHSEAQTDPPNWHWVNRVIISVLKILFSSDSALFVISLYNFLDSLWRVFGKHRGVVDAECPWISCSKNTLTLLTYLGDSVSDWQIPSNHGFCSVNPLYKATRYQCNTYKSRQWIRL